jgi:hypothetical protein
LKEALEDLMGRGVWKKIKQSWDKNKVNFRTKNWKSKKDYYYIIYKYKFKFKCIISQQNNNTKP